MLNAPHILATALLLLTAFLIGAVLGSLARAAANRLLRKPAGAASAIVVNPVTSAEPALVVAPVIEPLPNPATPVAPENVPTPDFAETMMALATGPLPEIKMPVIAPLPAVEGVVSLVAPLEPLQPAHVAGETTAGRHITSPHVQPVSVPPTVVTDSQSAEVIPFPTQPAPPNMADVAAELESLLSQAVAADAEAPPSDPDEAAAEEPPAAEAALPDADPPAVVWDTGSVLEPPPVGTASEEAPVSADAVGPPQVLLPPVAEPAPIEIVDAGAVAEVLASEPPGPTAVEPLQSAVDIGTAIEGARPDDDTAPDSTAVTETPAALAELNMAETAAELEPEPGSSELEPTSSAVVEPQTTVVGEPTEGIAAEPVVDAPELPAVQPPIAAPKLSAEEEEAAAMRAIEGNWSPRRKTRHARPLAEPEGAVETADAAVKASGAAVAAAAQAASAVVEPEPDPNKPVGISAPRQGRADDLTHIIGVLPIIETALNNLGIYHFDQVAELGEAQIDWVETHLGIAGRIGREHWREQASELASLSRVKVAAES